MTSPATPRSRRSRGTVTTEVVTATLVDRNGVRWRARVHEARTDRPVDLGGGDSGPMASEILLAALASCTATTVAKVAEKRRLSLREIEISAFLDFDDEGEPFRIRLRVLVASRHDPVEVMKALDIAERLCTISHMLRIPIERDCVVEPTADTVKG